MSIKRLLAGVLLLATAHVVDRLGLSAMATFLACSAALALWS